MGRSFMPSTWAVAGLLSADEIRRVRRVLLISGVLALLAGAASIVVPIAASVTMTLFVGWMLMFYGVVSGFHAIRAQAPGRTKAWRLLNAVLALAVGFYLVVLPLNGTITLTFLLAVWFFGTGVFSLAAAWQQHGQPGVGWLAVNGVLSLVLGVLIAVSLPSSAAWAIGLLVGIYLIWWGMDALIAATMLKRLDRPPSQSTLTTP
jgi:uncharacterized membrane protein HdeD (DUF308 family)